MASARQSITGRGTGIEPSGPGEVRVRRALLSVSEKAGIVEFARGLEELGVEKLMFQAADPDVFAWYIKNYGAHVNLFVDHSQIVQLECLRAGIWGTKSLRGRVVTYKK